MADTKISGLPASTVPLAGTEVLPIVQSTTTKQVSVANLTAGRAVDTLNLSTSGSTSTTPVLGFNASNCNIALGATIASTYLQAVMQNKSGTAGASTNWAVGNDLGTDSSYYGEFGMNSSVFSASTPADFFSINNGIYFSGHDGDVSLGSGNGYKTYLAWGTTGQSAHVINATGALGFSTNLGTTPALSGTTGFGTSGQALISAGSAAAPAWGTLGVAGGGTGLTTLTANYIPYGNGTSAFQSSSGFTFDGTNFQLASANNLNWNSDTYLRRDAANTLAQRNSTNAQTFRLYNTYTDASNYERLGVNWSGNTATIQTENAGTGSARILNINSATTIFQVNGVGKWGIDAAELYPTVDNSQTLGTPSFRIKNIYTLGLTASTTIQTGGYTVATLPTGVVGMRAYVTNALAPAYGVAVAGGGAVTIPVFYNGANWICA